MDAKKVMVAVFVGLVLFYAITQPTQATAAITTLLGWLKDGATAIMGYFARLFG
jgi:hypothetical protein